MGVLLGSLCDLLLLVLLYLIDAGLSKKFQNGEIFRWPVMACNLRTARSAAEEQGGLRIRRRPPQSVQHGCCVCFRRYILNNKAAHIAERAMCAASHKQARGDVGESKKNRSIQIGCFDWSEWRDLNSRPLDPQSSALPTAPHPEMCCSKSAQL